MQWLYPAGIWGLLSLALITALYLLRRRSKSVQVPSLLLWKLSANEQLASRPFQKLKKNLLYFLQMLLALLLVLALMRPAVSGGMRGETVMVFDLSASMQARGGSGTRLEAAQRKALALLDGMHEGDRVTVLAAGRAMETRITRSADLNRVRGVISALRAENGAADMDGAVSLALAMRRDVEGLNIIVFSDDYESVGAVQVVRVGQGADNRAVLSLSAADGQAFARVANYGAAAELTLELYADGALCDMAGLSLEAGEIRSVVMQSPPEFDTLRVCIAQEDAIAADNERWYTAQGESVYRVALAGENIFLEKALLLRKDIALLRTTVQEAQEMGDIDLYVFDGALPENLPAQGAVLAVAPGGAVDDIACAQEKTAPGMLRAAYGAAAQEMTRNLLLDDMALRCYTPLMGGQAVLRWQEDTLLAVTETAGRRAAVLGFDLHDSNLPLKGDFPVLMQNILAYLLPETRQALEGIICGETVTLPYAARAARMELTLPSGRREECVPGSVTDDTMEQGVYTLRIDDESGAQRAVRFAVHMDTAESDVRAVGSLGGVAVTARLQTAAGEEVTFYVLLAFLALLLVEWGVSRRVA